VLRGLVALRAAAAARSRELDGRAADALNEAAQDIHNESQRRVPVDTGNLKASARITPARPDNLAATVTYGGTAAAYAPIVHEIHRSKGKYLEAPARELAPQFVDGVKVELRKSLT
jgi:hypothetical protein